MKRISKILSLLIVLTFVLTACSFSSEKSVKVTVNGANVVDAKVGVDTSEPNLIVADINTTQFPRMAFGTLNGQPINWYIVTEDDNTRILFSEKILGSLQYNSDNQPIEWQNTTLHHYLNNDFVEECFSSEERARITTTNDEDDDIVTMPTLANLQELFGEMYYVERGFYGDKNFYHANKDIVAKPFDNMIANTMDTFDNNTYARLNEVELDARYDFGNDCGSYWVLDQDNETAVAFYITATGYVGNVGYDETDIGYRPIIRIRK